MSQHCTIGIIGFTPAMAKEVNEFMDHSILDIRIGGQYLLETSEEYAHNLDSEVDIILLYSKNFTTPVEEIIQELRVACPLTEIVLVSADKNYGFAIDSFRAGVRDIISYPLNKKELLASFERSQSFRSLYQKSKSLSDIVYLLQQFGDYKKFHSSIDFLMRADEFLQNKFGAEPLIVISYPLKSDEKDVLKGEFRTLWNQTLYQKGYDFEEVKEIINKFSVGTLRDQSRPFIETNINETTYFLFDLGQNEKSCFLGVFKIPKDNKSEYLNRVLGHFCRLIQNAYQQFLLIDLKDELVNLANVDEVTGAFNQRRLNKDLDKAIVHYQRYHEIFSVVFIDVDHFKSVNDGHGHLVGSQLLEEMAGVLRKNLRDSDTIYRYGGDEFVVLIPNIDCNKAFEIGTRILDDVKNHKFISPQTDDFRLSVSIGIAEFPSDAASKEEVLQIADDMMYKAKNNGRGRVVTTREMFEESASEEKLQKKSG